MLTITTVSIAARSLSWAILHSLWQGLLIWSTLSIVLKALSGTTSRVRHYLSFGAFTGMTGWFIDTWMDQYQRLKGYTVYITQSGYDSNTTTTIPVSVSTAGTSQQHMLDQLLPSGVDKWYPYIISIYGIGILLMLGRLLINIGQLRSLKNKDLYPAGDHWDVFVAQAQKQLGILRNVRVYISTRINVPMMMGIFRPVILLPLATINNLTTEQVEAIILHELAHIRRYDYLLNIFQTIVETLLFFNPFIWLTSRIIAREREHCCDDLVVSSSASPLSYAQALALLETQRQQNVQLTLAATGHKNQLFTRIKRIMEMKTNRLNYRQLTIILVAIMAITFTAAMFTFSPTFAQKSHKDEEDVDSGAHTVTKYKSVTVDENGRHKTVTKTRTSGSSDDAPMPPIPPVPPVPPVVVEDEDSAPVNVSFSASSCGDIASMVKDIVMYSTNAARSAIANIDFDAINENVNESMQDAQKEIDGVDWNAIKAEIDQAMAEVDKELKDEHTKKIIKDNVHEKLEEAKRKLQQAKAQIARKEAEVQAKAARKHKDDNSNFENMLNQMQKEGLINRSDKYTVKKEDGELYINGQKQSKDVYSRYSSYLKGDEISIKGSKGSLSITVTNN